MLEEVLEGGFKLAELVSMREHPVLCNAFLAVSALAIAGALHAITRRTAADPRFRWRVLRAAIAAVGMVSIVFVLVAIEWEMSKFLCFLGCDARPIDDVVRAWAPWTIGWCIGSAGVAAWNAPWIREPAG